MERVWEPDSYFYIPSVIHNVNNLDEEILQF